MTNKTNPVVVIGNFDGVHRGHAALLAQARTIADAAQAPMHVLTFEPHPRSFFKPDGTPFRLTSPAMKEHRLQNLGADKVITLPFNADLSGLDPKSFIDRYLVHDLNAGHIVVGADFHFGKGRGGHVDDLQKDGRFAVTPVALIGSDETPVSSTRIRAALEAGDMDAANAMLGWDWELEGVVQHGDKRGRELGFPTANIDPGDSLVPAFGIYAVRVRIEGEDTWRMGAANIGLRPMFALSKPLVEVFILDYSGDLYGKTLRIRPIAKLRDEAKYEGLEALKAQLAKDCEQARDILISRP